MDKIFCIGLFLTIFCWSTLQADQLRMKNGDSLTGEIQKADSSSVVLKTEYAGELTISMSGVQEIAGSQPVRVSLKDGTILTGIVSQKEGELQITTETGTIKQSLDAVEAIRAEAIYQSEVERYNHPGWTELWSGFVESGLSLTGGNSETTNFALGANAARTTKKDKTSFYMASLYAKDSTSGESRTTANAIRGGGRYEYNLNPKFNVFGFSDLEHDQFQNLDLRWVLGGGIGWYLHNDDKTQFQVFGGASYNHENFKGDLTRNSGELLAGQDFAYKLSDRMSLKERFVLFPNLSDSGEFRANFDTALLTSINQWLDWHITFSDRYLSNPVGGAEENDVLLTTGIRINFNQ